MDLNSLNFEIDPSWKAAPAGFFIPEFATAPDGTRYMRGTGRKIPYRMEENGDCVCTVCGGLIMAAGVCHSIHDGPFPLSGSGRVHHEEIPYCPKCETKPDSCGSFIRP
jgi:hypothetical protein